MFTGQEASITVSRNVTVFGLRVTNLTTLDFNLTASFLVLDAGATLTFVLLDIRGLYADSSPAITPIVAAPRYAAGRAPPTLVLQYCTSSRFSCPPTQTRLAQYTTTPSLSGSRQNLTIVTQDNCPAQQLISCGQVGSVMLYDYEVVVGNGV